MFLARSLTGASYPRLGQAFGGKHHTTIISAVAKMARRILNDGPLHAEVQTVRSILVSGPPPADAWIEELG